jgi:hypothetical protein
MTQPEPPFVQLQVQPGLFGVVKLRWRTWPTRNWLSFVLAAVFLGCSLAVIVAVHRGVSNPPTWYITLQISFAVGLVAVVVFRLILEGTVSRPPPGSPPPWDRQLADRWWTPIHTLTGITLGIWLVPFLLVAALTILWEIFEVTVPGFGDEEITGNHLIDILSAWAGWVITIALICPQLGLTIPILRAGPEYRSPASAATVRDTFDDSDHVTDSTQHVWLGGGGAGLSHDAAAGQAVEVTTSWIRQLILEGRLPAVKVGQQWVVPARRRGGVGGAGPERAGEASATGVAPWPRFGRGTSQNSSNDIAVTKKQSPCSEAVFGCFRR